MLHRDVQHNGIRQHNNQHNNIILNAVRPIVMLLNVIMLNVIMLNVIMLNAECHYAEC